jgi:membrane protein DedA with SNARE-associated domain
VHWFSPETLHHFIATHGYWAVGVIIGLESVGIPLPGETVLVLASLYAGTHDNLNIWGVIASAATGAIVGDNIGYWVGREFGYRLLLRYRSYVGLSDSRIKLGQYLFLRQGGKVVFFGRFVAILRILVAFLAGINRMDWLRFLLANATGGIVWSAAFGLGAYAFGKALLQVTGPLAVLLLLIAGVVTIFGALFVRSHEAELAKEAERALPGPLRPPHRYRLRRRRLPRSGDRN